MSGAVGKTCPALTGMMNQLPIVHFGTEAKILKAVLDAAGESIGYEARYFFLYALARGLMSQGLIHTEKDAEAFASYGKRYYESLEG